MAVGDFRSGQQCWIDVFSDVHSGGDSVELIVSFAGPEIASSVMLVSTTTESPSWPIPAEFVASMVTQACGELPDGFDDVFDVPSVAES